MKVLILGSGYAGLNAYYNLSSSFDKELVSESNEFIFYTAYFRHLMDKTNYISKIAFINQKKVKEIDLKRREVKFTDNSTESPDLLIIALGCDKSKTTSKINETFSASEISLGSESWRDEMIAIQLAFYLKKMGKKVSYYGDLLRWAGEKTSDLVKKELENAGITITEKAETIIPECRQWESIGEFNYSRNFEISKGVYAIGDIIKGWPRVGELAMRSGVFLGRYLSGKEKGDFIPILINILDTGRGKAIHIRSDKPWGGKYESVKVSRARSIMKRFIEKHYISRKGNMGFLYKL